ncbi:MAG TPA: pirin family protein [Ramlibacter sp.]|jgi:redox-sensitive bicupin YhaK (pirin superfamily)|uniref:pirin family protein n=1 Tax=Ramlibacter sp. TaxID=1917967 RepID=UPI002D64D88F|nr:pirin family protein [Ramlibacter sp.]HZY17410.1 pirin family protein [Ramlibacter sp.]
MDSVSHPRGVERLVSGQATSDGAGVQLTRLLTQDLQRRLDPFLMLDNFASDDPDDYGAGFPDHPHRGFETVTYMISGRMRHRDSHGHEGLLQNGGVQWMTAGRGLVHSEMPEQEHGVMEGFQLWLNLPARDKLREPWYRDIQSAEIPELRTPTGVTVRVIAGTCQGVAGSVQREGTEPLYLDLHFDAASGAAFSQPLPPAHNAFICVYRGALEVVDAAGRATPVPRGRMAVLANAGDGVLLRPAAGSPEPVRALLIAGKPLREPIAQYGPFVMNTRDQLLEAVEDFRNGRFG